MVIYSCQCRNNFCHAVVEEDSGRLGIPVTSLTAGFVTKDVLILIV